MAEHSTITSNGQAIGGASRSQNGPPLGAPPPQRGSSSTSPQYQPETIDLWQSINYLKSLGWNIDFTFTPPDQASPRTPTRKSSDMANSSKQRAPTIPKISSSRGLGKPDYTHLTSKFASKIGLSSKERDSDQPRVDSAVSSPVKRSMDFSGFSYNLSYSLMGKMIFLVDNTPTMTPHWPQLCTTLSIMAALSRDHILQNSIELFVSQPVKPSTSTTSTTASTLSSLSFSRPSSTSALGKFFQPRQFLKVLEENHPGFLPEVSDSSEYFVNTYEDIFHRERQSSEMTTLVIFTDGNFDTDAFVDEVDHHINKLSRKGSVGNINSHSADGLSSSTTRFRLNLVWFGSDPKYDKFPENWRGIVSVEPANGSILRMLVGDSENAVRAGTTELAAATPQLQRLGLRQ